MSVRDTVKEKARELADKANTKDATLVREVDDCLVRRANAIWVDTMVALTESGDLSDPLARKVITSMSILGDLRALLTRPRSVRNASDITLFKSVGFATLDLAAAKAALAAAAKDITAGAR